MATVPTAPPGHHPSYQQPCPGCHRDVTSGDSWTLQLPTARHTGLGSDPQNHQQPPSSIHPLLSVPPRERDHRAGSQAQGHDHLPVPRWVARKCQRPWNYRSVEDPLQPALRLLRRAQPGCGARGSLLRRCRGSFHRGQTLLGGMQLLVPLQGGGFWSLCWLRFPSRRLHQRLRLGFSTRGQGRLRVPSSRLGGLLLPSVPWPEPWPVLFGFALCHESFEPC